MVDQSPCLKKGSAWVLPCMGVWKPLARNKGTWSVEELTGKKLIHPENHPEVCFAVARGSLENTGVVQPE